MEIKNDWDDCYGGDLDSPYSDSYLLRLQKKLKDIDVCGVQDDCYNEICPCFLLKYDQPK